MSPDAKPVFTGGCQCGAVRFAIAAVPTRVSICHCRMCQKATGAPFASYADIPHDKFKWTRGTPATFRSSSIAARGFCAACGTPLSYQADGRSRIEITTGAFDRPDQIVPLQQFGTESRLAWVKQIANLPGKTTLENFGAEKTGGIANHQHADHERTGK